MSVTPGRKTILELGVGEVVLAQQSWTLQRDAKDMVPARAIGAVKTERVFSTGGDAWLLKPQFSETIRALSTAVGGYVQPADLDLAPGIASFPAFNRRDDLPGLSPNANLPNSGAPLYIKRVPVGVDWNEARLEVDEAAFPPPLLPTSQSYPLDRVLSGLVTYPANTPFALTFKTPEGFGGRDAMLNFYLGGEAESKPDGTSAGQFVLTFRGGGTAELREYDETTSSWSEVREEFRWNAAGEPPGGLICVPQLIPYAENRLWFADPHTLGYSTGGFTQLGLLATVAAAAVQKQPTGGTPSLYRETRSESRHAHTEYMTGAGVIRLDLQRPLRMPFGIIKGVYPAEGTLADSPFVINRYLPENTPIRVEAEAYLYPNTDVLCAIYDASTHTALAQDSNGAFLSVAGQRKYYAVFTLTSADGIGTPALYSYSIDIEGAFATRPAVPLVTERVRRVTVLGPDADITGEHANVLLEDEVDEAHVIRERDRLRSRILVVDRDTNVPISVLFEGETNQPSGLHRGIPGTVYPSPDWHQSDVRMAGLWARLLEQFHEQPPFSFASSKTGPTANVAPDPDTKSGYLPWRVTDAIRWLLAHAGVPSDELEVPDLPMRFWPSEHQGGTNSLAIYPHAYYAPMALSLIRDYLGGVLVRDPNAGTRGMWRVLIPPSPLSLNTLWTFSRDDPPFAGREVTAPGAYGEGVSFILKDTWQAVPEAPRASVVTVIGITKAGKQVVSRFENPAAIECLNGRRVPVKYGPNQALQTQEACNWLALRINDAVCQPRDWFDFTAPLVFVRDPQDPLQNPSLLRPLRHFDLIYIRFNGVDYRAILKNVNPGYEVDDIQMAHYQGRMLPV